MTDTQRLREAAFDVANKVSSLTSSVDQYDAFFSNIRRLDEDNSVNSDAFREGVMSMLDGMPKR